MQCRETAGNLCNHMCPDEFLECSENQVSFKHSAALQDSSCVLYSACCIQGNILILEDLTLFALVSRLLVRDDVTEGRALRSFFHKGK